MTLHPDEQARELFYELKPECQAHADGCKGCAESIASIAALLARTRLAEAVWWYDYNWGKPQSGKLGIERLREINERLTRLRQAAGETK